MHSFFVLVAPQIRGFNVDHGPHSGGDRLLKEQTTFGRKLGAGCRPSEAPTVETNSRDILDT